MAVEVTSWTKGILQVAISPIFWMLVLMGAIIVLFFVLIWLRNKRLTGSVIEVTDRGQDGYSFKTNLKCGRFGEKAYFKGLWTTGRQIIRTQDMRIVQYASTHDFKKINGGDGLFVMVAPNNPNILVPISDINIKGKELLMDIADASYNDAAVDAYNQAVKETVDRATQVLAIVGLIIAIIIIFIIILVVVNYAQNSQKQASDLLLQAGSSGAEACKNIAKDICGVKAGIISNAP